MAALAHGQVEGRLGRGVVQEDGVAVPQLELHIAEGSGGAGALDDRAVLDVHVLAGQIGGAARQDLVAGDRCGHIPGWIGHDGGERLLEAGRLGRRGTADDTVGVNRAAVLPVDHDGGGGVDLDPLGGHLALQPAATFKVQGDLAGPVFCRGRERTLAAGADPAVSEEAVAGLEATDCSLQLGTVDDALGGEARAVGGGEVAFGHQALDQGRNADIAHPRLDGCPLAEDRPAALTDQSAITDIAGGQVGIADVGRCQSFEPVDQAVPGECVVQPDGQVDAVLLHLPEVLDGLGAHPAFGENPAIGYGRGCGPHIGRVGHCGEGREVEIVAL